LLNKVSAILTLLFLLSSCAPQAGLIAPASNNPAADATPCPVCPTCPAPVVLVVTATPAASSPQMSVTATPLLASPNPTTRPAATLTPVVTTMPVQKTFTVQPNSPVHMQSFADQARGCAWTGVGGQVFDQAGQPVSNLVVMVDGELNGKRVEHLAMTGLKSAYGKGGYEITLGTQPFDSNNILKITLYDTQGRRLSEPFGFNTYNNCQRNLAIINFITSAGT
jgi:hypothetical protein